MSKVAGTALKIVGVAAVVVGTIATGGALLAGAPLSSAFGAGVSILGTGLGSAGTLIGLGALGAQVGGGLLAAGKAAKAQRTARAQNLVAQVQPDADAAWIFGETAVPLQVVNAETINDERVFQILAGGAHRVDSFGDLYIDDELVSFSGNSATGAWSGSLKRFSRVGSETQSAYSISGSTLPSTARGRGFPSIGLEWDLDGKKLKDRIPNRITQVCKGCLCYDPRKDSTQTGGSGAHRVDNQDTWEYSPNWALVNLYYLLGWKINGKLVVGRGVDPADIDMASFMACANVCDQIVDGKARYHVGGLISVDGNHARVTQELEATVGGKVTKSGGLFKIWAPHDDLIPVASITEADLVSGIDPVFRPAAGLPYNTAEGQYVEPSLLYQFETYPEVVEDTAKTSDGKVRLMKMDTPYLQDVDRAQRVVRQQVRRSRISGSWVLPVRYKYLSVDVFDIVSVNLQSTNNQTVLARVTDKTTTARGVIVLSLLAEDASVYDLSSPLASAPTRLTPPTFDVTDPVELTGLAAATVEVQGANGTSSDGVQLTWDTPSPYVVRTIIEFRVAGGAWVLAPQSVFTDDTAIILPLEPGTDYEFRALHETRFGVTGDWVTVSITTTNSALLAPDPSKMIQNPWVKNGLAFYDTTAGWDRSTIDRDGQPRDALRHRPGFDDELEYVLDRGGEVRFTGARINNWRFDTFPGEQNSFVVYGDTINNADGELFLGIAYYDGDGFIQEFIDDKDPVESFEAFGAKFRTFYTPAGASSAEVFCILTGHTQGEWYITGFAEQRSGLPVDPNVTSEDRNALGTDGLVFDANEIRNPSGTFQAAYVADFQRGLPAGWEAVNVSVEPTEVGFRFKALNGDPAFVSPKGLAIDGARNPYVLVRMRRVGAAENFDFFEQPVCLYRTKDHAFSKDFRKGQAIRFGDNTFREFVFDMHELTTGGDDWAQNVITRLRLDPIQDQDLNEEYEIDYIAVGRVSANAGIGTSQNIADGEMFASFDAADTDQKEIWRPIDLAESNTRAGQTISAGCYILSTGERTGQLEIIFEDANGSDIETFKSAQSLSNTADEQWVPIDNMVVPSGATQIRPRLLREAGKTGAVGARRLSINPGPVSVEWAPVRSDAEVGSTKGAPVGTVVGTTVAEKVESQAKTGFELTEDNGTALHSSSLNPLGLGDLDGAANTKLGTIETGADVTDYADERTANANLTLNADGTFVQSTAGGDINRGAANLTSMGAGDLAFEDAVSKALMQDGAASWRVGGKMLFDETLTNTLQWVLSATFEPSKTDGQPVVMLFDPEMVSNSASKEPVTVEFRRTIISSGLVEVLETKEILVTSDENKYPQMFVFTGTLAEMQDTSQLSLRFEIKDGVGSVTITATHFFIQELVR